MFKLGYYYKVKPSINYYAKTWYTWNKCVKVDNYSGMLVGNGQSFFFNHMWMISKKVKIHLKEKKKLQKFYKKK